MKPIRILIPLTTITDTFYIAACIDCDRHLPLPFESETDRDEWYAVHTQATGHRVDRHIELRGRNDDEPGQ